MSATDTNTPQEPLGVGKLVSTTMSIFFSNIVKIIILGFIPTLLAFVISGLLNGWGVALGVEDPNFLSPGAGLNFVLALVAQMAIYGITIALLVLLAYDAKMGKSRPLSDYFAPALFAALPIAILTIVATLAVGVGLALLVVPGLWIYAVFSVMAPAVLIDGVGFKGLGRSAALTQGYRWPVLGTLVIILLITFGIGIVVGLIIAGFAFLTTSGIGIAIAVVLSAFLYSLTYGLSGIAISLIYARLREIKEGVGVDKLAEVFD
jgi:hypothetical protein